MKLTQRDEFQFGNLDAYSRQGLNPFSLPQQLVPACDADSL